MTENPFVLNMKEYDSWYIKNKNLFISELLSIKELIHPIPIKRSLEIGAGTGRFSSTLNIDFSMDISEKFFLNFRERFKYFIAGKCENLPFKDNSFYFVFLITTFSFLKNPEKCLSEIYRVLKKDSFLIISDLNKNSKYGELLFKNKKESTFYREATFYSGNEIIEMVKKFDFKFENSTETIFDTITENTIFPVKKGHSDGGFISLKFIKN